MAYAPPRQCVVPGCPNLVTEPGVSRCTEHQKQYKKELTRPRDVKYTSQRWRKTSKVFLSRNPICERCGAPSEIAHHIIRKRDDGADDFDNLEALCRKCHEAEHHASGERWGRRER